MVMGGGDGVGGMGAIAAAVIKTLAKELEQSQVIDAIFCFWCSLGQRGGGARNVVWVRTSYSFKLFVESTVWLVGL